MSNKKDGEIGWGVEIMVWGQKVKIALYVYEIEFYSVTLNDLDHYIEYAGLELKDVSASSSQVRTKCEPCKPPCLAS